MATSSSVMRLLLLCSAVLMMMMMMSELTCADDTMEYVAETVVIVDKIGQDEWERLTGKVAHSDLETEIRSVLYEVNEIYKSLDTPYGMKIRFQLKELEFLDKNFLPANIAEHQIESLYAAQQFHIYLDQYNPKKFDVAILFTGNKLTLGSFIRAKGFAKVGKLCSKESVGVVRLTGTFDDVLTTAHELAHIFDARHDAETNCPQEGYIMTTGQPFLTPKRYQFSTCSLTSMANLISSLARENCLIKADKVNILKAPRYGTLVTPDALCKRKFNSLSYVSRQNYSSGYGDNVCLKLACRENTWKYETGREWRTTFIPSPDGLYCGKNKQCFKGKCVVSDSGRDDVSDICPFGDQPVIQGDFPKACGQVQAKDCPKFKDVCCHTCNENNPEYSKTADDECRKKEGPKSQMLRYYKTGATSENICGKLYCLKDPNFLNGKFNYKEYTSPDGMACGKNKRCRGGACVPAADGNPLIEGSCPFGDQPYFAGSYNKTCDDIVWRSGCSSSWGKYCCGSCNGKL